jgi:hypothetical protein
MTHKLKIVDVNHVQDDLRRFMRGFCLPREAQELICAALTVDVGMLCKVAIDRRGIAGAISYQILPDEVHIGSLGSLEHGTGSRLVTAVGKIAAKRHLPLTVAATARSKGFYERLKFLAVPTMNPSASIIRMKRAS